MRVNPDVTTEIWHYFAPYINLRSTHTSLNTKVLFCYAPTVLMIMIFSVAPLKYFHRTKKKKKFFFTLLIVYGPLKPFLTVGFIIAFTSTERV